jgi:hypothetical protein
MFWAAVQRTAANPGQDWYSITRTPDTSDFESSSRSATQFSVP